MLGITVVGDRKCFRIGEPHILFVEPEPQDLRIAMAVIPVVIHLDGPIPHHSGIVLQVGLKGRIEVEVVPLIADNPLYVRCFPVDPHDPDLPETDPQNALIDRESLRQLEEYLEKHSEIDEKRIYLMGVSAGGYMSINMLLQYPDCFAAAVVASEVYPDSKLTEADIEELSKNSIWFVHSADDEVAKIDKYDASTVRRLENAGAEDVHYTLYNCIIDSDGKYFDEDENVWQFSGHDSYIPIFRNQVDGLFAWLASQALK